MCDGAIRSRGRHKRSLMKVFKDMRAVDLREEMVWSLTELNERRIHEANPKKLG